MGKFDGISGDSIFTVLDCKIDFPHDRLGRVSTAKSVKQPVLK